MILEKNILFLLYNFPPEFGTAPKRNRQMVENFIPLFQHYFIITKKKADREKEKSLFEITAFDYRNLLRFFSRSGYVSESVKDNLFSKFFIKLINTFPINVLIGEGGGLYLWNAYRKASCLIREQGITHIYSSYRPISDHLTAYLLKRKFPHLSWIADFRDLPIEPHYKLQFFPDYHHYIYIKIFSRITIMTTVSEGLAKELKRYGRPVVPVMNGIKPNFIFPEKQPSEMFSLVYTGSMYGDERNARPLFEALKVLINNGSISREKIKIIYAGKDGIFWNQIAEQYGMLDRLDNRGVVPSEVAVSLQEQACINVLLTMASEKLTGIVTGKYIEYLCAGSPILCIVKNQNDSFFVEEFASMNLGISVSDQSEDFEKTICFIQKIYDSWCKSGYNEKSSFQSKILEHYATKRMFSPVESYLIL